MTPHHEFRRSLPREWKPPVPERSGPPAWLWAIVYTVAALYF